MNKYLYKIKDLEVPPWIKYWFTKRSKMNFSLSQILNGTSFDLTDTVNKKLHLINIFGNSDQETTTGKNLLNITLTGQTTNGITFVRNEDGSLTLNGTSTQGFGRNLATNITLEAGTYTISSTSVKSGIYISLDNINETMLNGNTSSKTFTIEENTTYEACKIWINNAISFSNEIFKVQIEKNSIATSYEPYTGGIASPNPNYPQEIKSTGDNGYIVEKFSNSDNTQLQTYTIPCQQPMRAIGNVKDTFVKVDGVWYERHNIRKVVLDGTENWVNEGGGAPFTLLNIDFKYPQSNNDMPLIKTNYYISVPYNDRWTDYSSIVTINQIGSSTKRVKFRNTAITSLVNWKNWLSHHNVTLIYVLVTPIDLPCTQEQITALEQLQKAKTYKDVTHIFSDDEVPAELQLQYYKEKGE